MKCAAVNCNELFCLQEEKQDIFALAVKSDTSRRRQRAKGRKTQVINGAGLQGITIAAPSGWM
jgi:hypothetical protein